MIREYECDVHGYFTVNRRISESTLENCSICDISARRVYTKAPIFGVSNGSNHIPNSVADNKEYEQWQRAEWSKWQDKTHPDNLQNYDGSADAYKKLTGN